mmetsp:Transcript_12983/g.29454  ORF Transcript_12983/g.29454 Transcript_12983/m.29454 type:complete len:143 (+) Transcript_12983:401-829(+)
MVHCEAPYKELAQTCLARLLGVELQKCSALLLLLPKLEAADVWMQQMLCQSPQGLRRKGAQAIAVEHQANGHRVGPATHELLGQHTTLAFCQCTSGAASNMGMFQPQDRTAIMLLAGLSRDLGTLRCLFSLWHNPNGERLSS